MSLVQVSRRLSERVSALFEGAESLKGVLGGRPYPVIWLAVGGRAFELHNMESEVRGQRTDRNALKRYCEKYIEICRDEGTWLFKPYFEKDDHFNVKPPPKPAHPSGFAPSTQSRPVPQPPSQSAQKRES